MHCDYCDTYFFGIVVNLYWFLLVGIACIVYGCVYSFYVDNYLFNVDYTFNVGICMKISLILVILLSGCANTENISINQFTETKNIYIDNTAVNNYVGNPCAFYVGSRCILMKKVTPRNPDLN